MVSPLLRSATAKPAIWDGVASPARISPIAHAVCSAVRSRRATRPERTSGQVGVVTLIRGWRERATAAAR